MMRHRHLAHGSARRRDAAPALLAGIGDRHRRPAGIAPHQRRALGPPPAAIDRRQRLQHAAHARARRGKAAQHHPAPAAHFRRQRCRDRPARHRRRVGLHLEGQRRDAVTVIGQLHPLEHRIGDAAIRRHRPQGRGDQWIDHLILATRMQPKPRHALPVARRPAQQLALRPDPPNAADRPRRQRHGEGHAITIGVGPRLALAAAAGRARLDQVGRPDHRPRHPDRAEQLRDRRAIARRLHRQVAQPRPLARRAAEQSPVDRLPRQRTQRTPDRSADRPPDRRQHQRRHPPLP